MNNQPKPRPSVQVRQRRLIDALKAYGVYEADGRGLDGRPDWLAAHFVFAWLEAWRLGNLELMARYLSDAEELLGARIFNAKPIGAEMGGEKDGRRPPQNI